MTAEQDQTTFDWIRYGRDERPNSRPPDWKGNFVSSLIPPGFESYGKILHPIHARYEFIDNPLSERENAILKIPSCEPLKSFVEKCRKAASGDRILWRDLAALLGVPFAPGIKHEWYRETIQDPWCWPRLLSGPAEGWLEQEQCRALAGILEASGSSQECLFRFSDIPFYAPANQQQPQLFRGSLGEVCDFQSQRRLSFEYWWPHNRQWCVCSDYDLEFTVVGGSRGLLSRLLRDDVLECIEVTQATRIDQYSPMP